MHVSITIDVGGDGLAAAGSGWNGHSLWMLLAKSSSQASASYIVTPSSPSMGYEDGGGCWSSPSILVMGDRLSIILICGLVVCLGRWVFSRCVAGVSQSSSMDEATGVHVVATSTVISGAAGECACWGVWDVGRLMSRSMGPMVVAVLSFVS